MKTRQQWAVTWSSAAACLLSSHHASRRWPRLWWNLPFFRDAVLLHGQWRHSRSELEPEDSRVLPATLPWPKVSTLRTGRQATVLPAPPRGLGAACQPPRSPGVSGSRFPPRALPDHEGHPRGSVSGRCRRATRRQHHLATPHCGGPDLSSKRSARV